MVRILGGFYQVKYVDSDYKYFVFTNIFVGAKKKYVDPCTSSMDLQGTTLNGASNEVSSTRVVARDQLRMGVDTFETPTVVHSSFNSLRKPKETFVSRKSDGQRDSVRHVFESNDTTATSGIDEESDASSDGGSICDEDSHLISSGEASTAKDPEWGILSKFQRDFRLRTNISVRKFLILLGMVPTKTLEAFLWKPQKLIPSGRAGTIGCLLREKLTEFMEKELKNCEYAFINAKWHNLNLDDKIINRLIFNIYSNGLLRCRIE